jgi:hypothetical protein
MRVLLIMVLSLTLNDSFFAQTEKKKKKEPKHFFNTTFFFDYYHKPEVDLDTTRSGVGKKLQSYGVTQSSISFYSPLLTINKYNRDSTVNSNFHLLIAGTAYWLQPHFKGITQHTLAKYGLGIRAIYNTGKKSIFFVESSPFVTSDITYGGGENTWRMAGTLLWSYSFNPHFNFRLGATKSFLWGNRYYLPFVGIRIGRVDRFNFSVQFPRNISLNVPMGPVVRMSLYSKPQGGVFNFSNKDTLYNKQKYSSVTNSSEKNIHFGRFELLTGLRVDVVPLRWLSLYFASGFSTRNGISFYSNNFNKNQKGAYGDFYAASPRNTIFVNFGMTIRFGKTKSYYNNQNIYEAIDLNNTLDPGENNTGPGNINIPIEKRKMPKQLKTSEIQDLIDANDF